MRQFARAEGPRLRLGPGATPSRGGLAGPERRAVGRIRLRLATPRAYAISGQTPAVGRKFPLTVPNKNGLEGTMSRNDRELEIKFSTDSPGLKAAFDSPVLGGVPGKGVSARSLISTYFDTLDRSLNKRRIALRVRRGGPFHPDQGGGASRSSHAQCDPAFVQAAIQRIKVC